MESGLEYRGYTINIYQNPETVWADIRGLLFNKHTKKSSHGVVAEGDEVEVVKRPRRNRWTTGNRQILVGPRNVSI